MPQVQIYLDEKEDERLERYMKANHINSKLEAVKKIIRELKLE